VADSARDGQTIERVALRDHDVVDRAAAPRSARSGPSTGGTVGATTVRGAAVVYRLYDVGFEIHLDRAVEALAAADGGALRDGPERLRPVRGEAQAIQIANPPVTISLGTEAIEVPGARADAAVSARIFDFGVVSLRLNIPAADMSWSEFIRFGNAVDVGLDLSPIFDRHLAALLARLAPAVERPAIAPVTEDYVVFRITPPVPDAADGGALSAGAWHDEDFVPLLLNEQRALSETARRELLPHRFSYYTDDLTILTWDNALIIEPAVDDADVQYILEFANAQLLELRVYDAILDAQLPEVYDRVAAARARAGLLRGRYSAILADLQGLVADSTELVERVDSALKVTDDVYLARIYTAALEIFRGREWRAAIDRKLAIIRETYVMLNAEAQAARSEAIELLIVVLITAEIVLGVFSRR